MTYEMIQNLARSNNRIKSQLFDLTWLGFLVLILIRRVLIVATFWFTIWSCCIYLLPFFWLWNSRFSLLLFWIFLDFDIWFYALIRAEKNTVSTPVTCQLNYLLNHSYSIYFTHYLSTLLFYLPIRQVGSLPNWVTYNPSSYEEILDGFLNP